LQELDPAIIKADVEVPAPEPFAIAVFKSFTSVQAEPFQDSVVAVDGPGNIIHQIQFHLIEVH
jgi:hypothetical protein